MRCIVHEIACTERYALGELAVAVGVNFSAPWTGISVLSRSRDYLASQDINAPWWNYTNVQSGICFVPFYCNEAAV